MLISSLSLALFKRNDMWYALWKEDSSKFLCMQEVLNSCFTSIHRSKLITLSRQLILSMCPSLMKITLQKRRASITEKFTPKLHQFKCQMQTAYQESFSILGSQPE
jgi:hypothetical protein